MPSALATETADERAARLKFKNLASSKKGDLETHDRKVFRLLDVVQQRLSFAHQIQQEFGPLSLELRLAVRDLETSLEVLKEVVL